MELVFGGEPYPRNRVILNAVVVVLSIALALTLLAGDLTLLLYYLTVTIIVMILAYFIKMRLYAKLIAKEREETDTEMKGTSWRILLLTFLMLLFFLTFPLFLAGVLPPATWFIAVVGFTTGIGASEVIVYLKSRKQ